MSRSQKGDPKDREEHTAGGHFVPVTAGWGTEVVVPGPLTPGRPKPEPEERWTLAPVRRPDAPAAEDGTAAEGMKGDPVEPIPPGPGAGGGEAGAGSGEADPG